MGFKFFAMDTCFGNSLGSYDFQTRCEMLSELGYDAIYLSFGEEVPHQAKTAVQDYDLDVAGVYAGLDIAAERDASDNQRVLSVLDTFSDVSIEFNLHSNSDPELEPSSAAGDSRAQYWLEQLLDVAERRNLRILMYPHIWAWLERIEDGVRLCRRLDHPRLGVVFCAFHWYAVDGSEIEQRLTEAAPYLKSVNICGSRKRPGEGPGLPATIEPLDSGELDTFSILGLLKKIGYEGMVGLQGYSTGGDIYMKLKRSITAFRDMERRLAEHPSWPLF